MASSNPGRCPECDSDDVRGVEFYYQRQLTCMACLHVWLRTPRDVCPQCNMSVATVMTSKRQATGKGSVAVPLEKQSCSNCGWYYTFEWEVDPDDWTVDELLQMRRDELEDEARWYGIVPHGETDQSLAEQIVELQRQPWTVALLANLTDERLLEVASELGATPGGSRESTIRAVILRQAQWVSYAHSRLEVE